MLARSAHLLSLGVALPLMGTALPAAASENDDVMKVVDDFCVRHRGSLKDAAARASKLPFGARYLGEDRGPPPVREVWLAKLGTGSTLAFSARSASEPVNDCRLVSHVHDLADLVARFKTAFDLGEPKTSDVMVQLRMNGQKTIDGTQRSVELIYGFEDNKPSGAFTLTISR